MNGRRTVKKTDSGNPITLTDSVENKSLGMKLYGWSKQDGEPSPDNPVEIESAGMKWSTGKNLFHVTKESDCNKANPTTTQRIILPGEYACGLTFTNLYSKCLDNVSISDRKISYSVTGIGYGVGVGVSVENGKKYAVSAKMKNGDIYAVFYDESGTLISYTNIASRYFEAPDDTQYTVLLFRKSVVTSANEEIVFEDIQIEETAASTTYEPYTGGIPKPYGDKITVKVCGRNLWNWGDVALVQNRTVVFCLDAGTYVFTSDVESSDTDADYDLVAFTYEDGKMLFYQIDRGKQKSIKVVLTRKTRSITFYASRTNDLGEGDTATFKNIMIGKSAEVFPYEPYRNPQSTSIATPNGLPGIPLPSNTAGITYTDANGQAWISDEIDLERGKYVQRVGKVDLENLSWHLIGNDFRSGAISDSKVYAWTTEIANLICSHYACKMTSYNMNYNSDGQDNLIGMYTNQIEIKDTRYNKDVDLFKQSLSGVYAYYVLAIPVERDLTSAELAEYIQLYSYKPTTVVENDSDCWMDVTYRGKK